MGAGGSPAPAAGPAAALPQGPVPRGQLGRVLVTIVAGGGTGTVSLPPPTPGTEPRAPTVSGRRRTRFSIRERISASIGRA